jgi:hypothetical protein
MDSLITYSLKSLYEFAIPSKGSYRNYIGSVVFGDY